MREHDEEKREMEFSSAIEQEKAKLQEERRNFELEKEMFEKKMKEMEEKRDENDSGIGSRNESAELYEADADRSDLSEQEEEEEIVPPRRNRWHPEVGRAPPPNLQSVRGRTKHYNTQYKPKSPRRVEIFNDKDYLKEMRHSRGKRRRRRKQDDKSDVDDPDRPRSLVLQRVESDHGEDKGHHSSVSRRRHHRSRRRRSEDEIEAEKLKLEKERREFEKM